MSALFSALGSASCKVEELDMSGSGLSGADTDMLESFRHPSGMVEVCFRYPSGIICPELSLV